MRPETLEAVSSQPSRQTSSGANQTPITSEQRVALRVAFIGGRAGRTSHQCHVICPALGFRGNVASAAGCHGSRALWADQRHTRESRISGWSGIYVPRRERNRSRRPIAFSDCESSRARSRRQHGKEASQGKYQWQKKTYFQRMGFDPPHMPGKRRSLGQWRQVSADRNGKQGSCRPCMG
jgi:hypothetical protein